MRLFIIRHAEHDPKSGADPPLLAAGHAQAARLAQAVKPFKLDRVVSSTLKRAIQTATPLARALQVPLLTEPDLVDIRIGELATWEPAGRAEWERITDRWRSGDLAAAPPGGETWADLTVRVEPVVRRLLAEPCEHGFAIVAHAAVNTVIVGLLCPELRPGFGAGIKHSYTGVWELEGEGTEFRVLRRNDTSHLGHNLT